MRPTTAGLALLLAGATAGNAADVNVTVNPAATPVPISPLIYGVNFGDTAQANRIRWPVRRWGGNAVTRYSWEHDISNRASDWFFYNIENDNPNPGLLPDGSASDRFIDETRAAGGEVLLTVPTIRRSAPPPGTRRGATPTRGTGSGPTAPTSPATIPPTPRG